MPLSVGDRFAHYDVTALIGEGGMGEVYQATDTKLGRHTTPEGDPSQSPTLTAAATQMGVIIGTAAYMSPEQAAGTPVDRSADLWAFGATVFEMLTGERLFRGETGSHVLAAVVKTDPDWSSLPRGWPDRLVRLLQRCLERRAGQCLRDVREPASSSKGSKPCCWT